MIRQIRTAFRNSQDTLLRDAFGAVALVVVMLAVLHIPGTV